jgi:drug/metabolite transporter (DMT)-like permease
MDTGQTHSIGYLLVLLAIVSGSISTVYARRFMQNMSAFDVTSTRMIAAALVVMPLSLLFVGFDLSPVTTMGYLGLIYATAVGTFSGMMLSFYIIKRFGATAGSLQDYIMPIFATLGGIVILGETFTLGMLGGMVLIILGIMLINRRERALSDADREAAQSAPTPNKLLRRRRVRL